MTDSGIVRSDSRNEKYLDERCFITEILNTESHSDISIAKARVLPGITTALHKVKYTSEKYYILSGTGEVEIDGVISGQVKSGDLVLIPQNITQRIKNTGADDLIFLCVCTPRFEPENYEEV